MHKSRYDGTVRLAPVTAFSQQSILDLLNKNTVKPNSPKEIFTGSFIFEDEKNGGEHGLLPFPAEISILYRTEGG